MQYYITQHCLEPYFLICETIWICFKIKKKLTADAQTFFGHNSIVVLLKKKWCHWKTLGSSRTTVLHDTGTSVANRDVFWIVFRIITIIWHANSPTIYTTCCIILATSFFFFFCFTNRTINKICFYPSRATRTSNIIEISHQVIFTGDRFCNITLTHILL